MSIMSSYYYQYQRRNTQHKDYIFSIMFQLNFTKFGHFSFSCLFFWFDLGKNFLQWNGPEAQMVLTEPELIKEILNNRDNTFPKQKTTEGFVKKLLGDGLVTSEGEKWAKMRKLANSAFHAESLKVSSQLQLGLEFKVTLFYYLGFFFFFLLYMNFTVLIIFFMLLFVDFTAFVRIIYGFHCTCQQYLWVPLHLFSTFNKKFSILAK